MKIPLQILLVLIAGPLLAQNFWKPINFPDTLFSKAINAEKEGILFVASGSPTEFNGLFRSFDDGNTWEVYDISEYPLYTLRVNADWGNHRCTVRMGNKCFVASLSIKQLLMQATAIIKKKKMYLC